MKVGNLVFYGIIGVIIVVFAILFVVLSGNKEEQDVANIEAGPYTDISTEDMLNNHAATVSTLGNENYRFNETFDDVMDRFDNEEDFFLYVWSPTCNFCTQATPLMVEAVEDLDIEEDFVQVNANVYDGVYSTEHFEMPGTPYLMKVEGGKVVSEVVGLATADEYNTFFEENK